MGWSRNIHRGLIVADSSTPHDVPHDHGLRTHDDDAGGRSATSLCGRSSALAFLSSIKIRFFTSYFTANSRRRFVIQLGLSVFVKKGISSRFSRNWMSCAQMPAITVTCS